MSVIQDVIAMVQEKDAGQPEFHQAVREVMESLEPTVKKHPEFVKNKIYERIVVPDRAIIFRVPWVDDHGEVQVNRGYRVQFSNAIGPYKGGLRLHPSVNLSIVKFLGFEQIFKNSLTTLPMGGGKGGSDFDPKGKSDMEVMRFCQAFMRELFRHIGPDTDVPAGDIGVGGREIGYMYGYYKKITNEHTSVLTGKSLEYGGSLIRPEATGYGAVFLAAEMLGTRNQEIQDKVVAVSASGNVAQYTVEKINQLGGKVVTLSDSDGTIIEMLGGTVACVSCWDRHDKKSYTYSKEGGIDPRFLLSIVDGYGTISKKAAEEAGYIVEEGEAWISKEADVLIPAALEGQINSETIKKMSSRVKIVAEGANGPTTPEADEFFKANKIFSIPDFLCNAGGVTTSYFEQVQNDANYYWERDAVLRRLDIKMTSAFNAVLERSEKEKVYMRDAAYMVAIDRVVKAMELRGWLNAGW